jgi:hypothetical protein
MAAVLDITPEVYPSIYLLNAGSTGPDFSFLWQDAKKLPAANNRSKKTMYFLKKTKVEIFILPALYRM